MRKLLAVATSTGLLAAGLTVVGHAAIAGQATTGPRPVRS